MQIPTRYFPHYTRYKRRIKEIPTFGNPKRIVLISDTHISRGRMFNPDIFKKGIEEINNIKNVDYIIHLGDLTHDGTFLNYEYALKCLEPIRKDNFFVIPGNHDAKNVGYLLFEEFFGSRGFEVEDKDVFILGIDSSIPDQDSGRIGKKGIERSQELFLNYQDNIRIFCFHHQLIPIPLTGRERSAIIDGGDALKMILETNIDIVLNGHRHISNVYSCTNGDGELVIFNSGTLSCNKTRYKELFTYTILDVYSKAVTFTTKKLYDGEEIKRGRYINRIFHPNSANLDNKLLVKIVHIANTHFSQENYIEKRFEKAVKQINALNADLVIHSGDLTNSNKYSEFKNAYNKLKEIFSPKIIIPGDNDLRTIGWEVFPEMIGPLEPYFENNKVRVIGINSINNAIANGNIGRKKVQETIKFLNQKPKDKINIITFYNNVIPHPKTRFETMLSDSGNALKFFTDPDNNVHFILTGHDHVSFSLQLEDTVLCSCGTVSSKDFLDLKENTYNIINCYENGFVEIEEVEVATNNSQKIGQYWINLNVGGSNNEFERENIRN